MAKGKKTTCEFGGTGSLSMYKLAPYPSISDMWVLLLLVMDLWLFVLSKVLLTKDPHFKIKSLWHVARQGRKGFQYKMKGKISQFGILLILYSTFVVPGLCV